MIIKIIIIILIISICLKLKLEIFLYFIMNQLEEYHNILSALDKYITNDVQVDIVDTKSTISIGHCIIDKCNMEHYSPPHDLLSRQHYQSLDIMMARTYSTDDSDIINYINGLSKIFDEESDVKLDYTTVRQGDVLNGSYYIQFSKYGDNKVYCSLNVRGLCYSNVEAQIIIKQVIKHYVEYKYRPYSNAKSIMISQPILDNIFGISGICQLCLEYLVS